MDNYAICIENSDGKFILIPYEARIYGEDFVIFPKEETYDCYKIETAFIGNCFKFEWEEESHNQLLIEIDYVELLVHPPFGKSHIITLSNWELSAP